VKGSEDDLVAGWLCIGTATATVVTLLVDRYRRAHGEPWDRAQKRNMALLAITIVFAWPGFYGVLALWQIPRARHLIVCFMQTGWLK
jgi:hypothetical protein